LTQIFEQIGKPARGKTYEAIEGFSARMESDLENFGETEAGDDVLIGRAGDRARRDLALTAR
jgi:ferritin-like metal-binding protein YciE